MKNRIFLTIAIVSLFVALGVVIAMFMTNPESFFSTSPNFQAAQQATKDMQLIGIVFVTISILFGAFGIKGIVEDALEEEED